MNFSTLPDRFKNRPGFVATEITVNELVSRIRESFSEVDRNDKFNLNRLIEAGKDLLRLKEKCVEIGQWTEQLAKTKISKQRASDAMRIAQLPAADLTKCQSINDARNLLPAESSTSTGGHTGQDEEEIEQESSKEPTATPSSNGRSRANPSRNGHAEPASAKPQESPPSSPKPPAESSPKPSTNGKVIYDCRIITDALGHLAREMNKCSKAHQQATEYADMRDQWERINASWKRWQKAM